MKGLPVMRFVVSTIFLAGSLKGAEAPPIISADARFHPVPASRGMVVSRERLASETGVSILQSGGNAVDAAVATAFVLAVTTPQAGNLGGGGFMLIHAAEDGETVALDFREKAPAAARPDMFLDATGEVDPALSRDSHRAVGVPGTVAGLALALEEFGTLTLSQVLAPAIRLAEDGFPVSRDLAFSLEQARERLWRSPGARVTFYRPDGSALREGAMLRLPALARVLRAIAEEGPAVFYEGWIARLLAEDMEAQGGILTERDLAAYTPVLRAPVRGVYRGYEVCSMPPPSSGGIHLVQMLNILSGYDLAASGHNSAAYLHLLAEAMKRAYADRARHLGDSDFYPVPQAWLVSDAYAADLRRGIDPLRATPSARIAAGEPPREGDQTTHFSIMDEAGNAVSCTTTLNFSFGTGYLVPGLGFFLNNEMDDFSARPGVPNAYGLIGGEANAIEPEKRMLSSMSPTLVLRDGRPVIALGSPGGSRIITATLQVLLNLIDFEQNVAEAVSLPRIHHQWLPDSLFFEAGISPDTVERLRERGHALQERPRVGNVNAAVFRDGFYYGAADPRALSGAARGY